MLVRMEECHVLLSHALRRLRRVCAAWGDGGGAALALPPGAASLMSRRWSLAAFRAPRFPFRVKTRRRALRLGGPRSRARPGGARAAEELAGIPAKATTELGTTTEDDDDPARREREQQRRARLEPRGVVRRRARSVRVAGSRGAPRGGLPRARRSQGRGGDDTYDCYDSDALRLRLRLRRRRVEPPPPPSSTTPTRFRMPTRGRRVRVAGHRRRPSAGAWGWGRAERAACAPHAPTA